MHPVTGKAVPGVEALDDVMLTNLRRIGCTAATLAVAYKGEVICSRGYGLSDRRKTVPTQPDTVIGLASCEKPFTAAAIRQMARDGRLDLDSSLMKFLHITPAGPVVDSRVWDITLRHLLEHKAGWQGEPFDRAVKIAHQRGIHDPVPVPVLLRLIMSQRLKDTPGTRFEYCNFCFETMRYVISKVTGRPAVQYFRQELFRPFGMKVVTGIEGRGFVRKPSDPPLVWNSDSGGPVSASAPVMLMFMHHFWMSGELRDKGNPRWQKNGGLPGSTAVMLWRSDGIDIAFLFNGRNDKATCDDIVRELEPVVTKLKK